MFRSTNSPRPSACVSMLLGTATLLCVGRSEPAPAAQPEPSPFAGCYYDEWFDSGGSRQLLSVSIDESGDIGGYISEIGELSGRISDDGFLRFTGVSTFYSFGGRGPRKLRMRSSFSGVGALDELSNLYGVLEDENGALSENFWPRCE